MILIDPDGKQSFNQSYNSEEAVINWRLSEYLPSADKAEIDYNDLMFKDQFSGMSIPALVDKYGPIAQDYYGGNTYPTNIEIDFALLFFGGTTGLSLKESISAGKYSLPNLGSHALKRINSGELTEAIIYKTYREGSKFIGHESGYQTIIGRNFFQGKSLVLGYDFEKNTIVTAYKTPLKKADKLVSKLTEINKDINKISNKSGL